MKQRRQPRSHIQTPNNSRNSSLPPVQPSSKALSRLALIYGVCFVFGIILFGVAWVINGAIGRHPYMDEVFHARQTWKYLTGRFYEWDDKITTPPGLYLLAIPYYWFVRLFCSAVGSQQEDAVGILRSLNLWLLIGSLILVHRHLVACKSTSVHTYYSLWHAFNIVTTPVLFFFAFLFYTDIASMFFVLLASDLSGAWSTSSLTQRPFASAFVCFLSLWFRQTNIVWSLFIAGMFVRNRVLLFSDHGTGRYSFFSEADDGCGSMIIIIHKFLNGLSHLLVHFQFLCEVGGYIAVAFAFILFAVWNGGIVLGDKSNHIAVLHLPQLFYFVAFAACLLAPAFLSWNAVVTLFRARIKDIPLLLIYMAAGIYVVRHYTIEHLFLISDNRHYTFYLWKNIFKRWTMAKYILIPIYMLCFKFVAMVSFSPRKSMLLFCLFWLCTAVAIVPSPLFEFRYFLIPYVFVRIYAAYSCAVYALVRETLFNIVTNTVVLYVFIYHPFEWPHAPGELQRFMF